MAMSCLFTPLHGFADDSNVKVRSLVNPLHSNAIQIGDVLERTIEVEVSADYRLPKTSLPIKGENRNGIELRDIAVHTSKSGESVIYTIALSYQVFASAAKTGGDAIARRALVTHRGRKTTDYRCACMAVLVFAIGDRRPDQR